MKTQTTKQNWLFNQADTFEENRFGAMSAMMIIQSCYGSIAAMYAVDYLNAIPLSFTVMITMAANAACIAQSPAKWCLGLFYTSLIINSIVLITMYLL